MARPEQETENKEKQIESSNEGSQLKSSDIDTKGVNPKDLFTSQMTTESVALGGTESPSDVAGTAAANMERANSLGQAQSIVEGAMSQGSGTREENLTAMQQTFQKQHSPYQLGKDQQGWYVYPEGNPNQRARIREQRSTAPA